MTRKITGRQKSEARRKIVITNPSICYYCQSTGLTQDDLNCPNCGFPQRGSQVAMKRFIWNVNNKHILLDDYINAIDKARYILISISVLCLVMAFLFLKSDDRILQFSFILTSLIYILIWHWSKSKPRQAILTGLIVYVVFLIVSGVFDPSSISKGGFGKIYILVGLYFGYKSIKKGLSLLAELETIKKAVDLNIRFQDSDQSIEE
ncbi:MAG: hypothetical protein ACK50A_04455 [Sphingobacteriaceae bacterium]